MVLEQLGVEITRAKRAKKTVAVMLADLDHFKQVNDTYGHPAGDAILSEAAVRLRHALRAYDSIGRYGGEEFLIVLPGCDTDAAVVVAERARTGVAAPVRFGDIDIPLSVSLGVASTQTASDEPDRLIQAADDALYRAKAAGRNHVFYEAGDPFEKHQKDGASSQVPTPDALHARIRSTSGWLKRICRSKCVDCDGPSARQPCDGQADVDHEVHARL